MNSALFVVVLITGLALVGAALLIAGLILYLMFDVETVFLFPWAVILKDLGVAGLFNILFFMVVLILGLVYAWKKGALEWK